MSGSTKRDVGGYQLRDEIDQKDIIALILDDKEGTMDCIALYFHWDVIRFVSEAKHYFDVFMISVETLVMLSVLADKREEIVAAFVGSWHGGKSTLIQSFVNKDKSIFLEPSLSPSCEFRGVSWMSQL